MLKKLFLVVLALMLVFGLSGVAAAWDATIVQEGELNIVCAAQYADVQDAALTVTQSAFGGVSVEADNNFICALQMTAGGELDFTATQVGEENIVLYGAADEDNLMVECTGYFDPVDIGYCWFDKYDHVLDRYGPCPAGG